MNEKIVLAIGNFDGLHKGHQKIIEETKNLAKNLEIQDNWGVLFFDPHPRIFLSQDQHFLIMSSEQKYEKLRDKNVPCIISLPFKDVFQMNPEEFFLEILVKKFNVAGVVTGNNFNFGKDKKGNITTIKELSLKHDVKYISVEEEADQNGNTLSSSTIRKLISEGKMNIVKDSMGDNFKIRSKVIHGRKLGRELGCPTANLDISEYVSPAYGVYATYAYIDAIKYESIASFGLRPTVEDNNQKKELLEVHIFDYNQDIYNKMIDVEFLEFIRTEEKFQSIDALKKQIFEDMDNVKQYFNIKE